MELSEQDKQRIEKFTGFDTLPERNWEEDFSHENGNYINTCIECKLAFMGHKRRVICKKCATPNWIELAKKKPPEDTKDNKAWAGAWLEGEMVGFAKCMVQEVAPLRDLLSSQSKEIAQMVQSAQNYVNGEKLRYEEFCRMQKEIAELKRVLKVILDESIKNRGLVSITTMDRGEIEQLLK